MYPWQEGNLKDWNIVGMNHYFVNDEKRIFVAMVKDGRCIKSEGRDSSLIWEHLQMQAHPSKI
jgi:hypothetical protein